MFFSLFETPESAACPVSRGKMRCLYRVAPRGLDRARTVAQHRHYLRCDSVGVRQRSGGRKGCSFGFILEGQCKLPGLQRATPVPRGSFAFAPAKSRRRFLEDWLCGDIHSQLDIHKLQGTASSRRLHVSEAIAQADGRARAAGHLARLAWPWPWGVDVLSFARNATANNSGGNKGKRRSICTGKRVKRRPWGALKGRKEK